MPAAASTAAFTASNNSALTWLASPDLALSPTSSESARKRLHVRSIATSSAATAARASARGACVRDGENRFRAECLPGRRRHELPDTATGADSTGADVGAAGGGTGARAATAGARGGGSLGAAASCGTGGRAPGRRNRRADALVGMRRARGNAGEHSRQRNRGADCSAGQATKPGEPDVARPPPVRLWGRDSRSCSPPRVACRMRSR